MVVKCSDCTGKWDYLSGVGVPLVGRINALMIAALSRTCLLASECGVVTYTGDFKVVDCENGEEYTFYCELP